MAFRILFFHSRKNRDYHDRTCRGTSSSPGERERFFFRIETRGDNEPPFFFFSFFLSRYLGTRSSIISQLDDDRSKRNGIFSSFLSFFFFFLSLFERAEGPKEVSKGEKRKGGKGVKPNWKIRRLEGRGLSRRIVYGRVFGMVKTRVQRAN